MSYRCSTYRRTGRKIDFVIAEVGYTTFVEQSCIIDPFAPATQPLDITSFMKDETDRLAVEDMGLTPNGVWSLIHTTFYGSRNGDVVQGLTQEQVISRVYRARRAHFGSDLHGAIEFSSLSLVFGSSMSFFQLHQASMVGQKLERIIGRANPMLLQLLKYRRSTLFLDGTFCCVPTKFYQLMVHDLAANLFVRVVYVLCTAKTQETYWNALHQIVATTDEKIDPTTAVCDFEVGLQDAVQVQFPEADIVGCYFHFKQACRRNIKKYGIPNLEVKIAMQMGALDMLTVIEHDKIAGSGIIEKWIRFWAYFRRTWLQRYEPRVWNVSGISHAIISRTNNPLERLNRELNSRFSTPHPSLPRFVRGIDALSRHYAQLLTDIPFHRARSRRRTICDVGPVDLPDPIGFPGSADHPDSADR